MGWVSIPLLSVGALVAAAERPPKVFTPLPPTPAEFALAPQPVYGPLRPIRPAHRLALLEFRHTLNENDSEVAPFAVALGHLTARYIEDAGRIADVTTSVCQEIRAAKQPALPSEIIEGALAWNRPPGSRPDVPRRFSDYARAYRTLRLKEGKNHQAAIAALKTPPPPQPKPH